MSARWTYDGVPVAQERPFGASVIVYRPAEGGLEFYAAEAAADCSVVLDREHDRFEWVAADRAPARCRPEHVARQLVLLLSEFD